MARNTRVRRRYSFFASGQQQNKHVCDVSWNITHTLTTEHNAYNSSKEWGDVWEEVASCVYAHPSQITFLRCHRTPREETYTPEVVCAPTKQEERKKLWCFIGLCSRSCLQLRWKGKARPQAWAGGGGGLDPCVERL